MTGIFSDQIGDGTIPETKFDSATQDKLNNPGGSWAVVAKGIIATGAGPTTVHTASVGKQYILVALNSKLATLFSAGDEDEPLMLDDYLHNQVGGLPAPSLFSPEGLGTFTDPPGFTTLRVSPTYIGVTTPFPFLLTIISQQSSGDYTELSFSYTTGAITVKHSAGGSGNTNGLYVIYEK